MTPNDNAQKVGVSSPHVVHELLTNIKRTCVRGRSARQSENNLIATCDHIENMADEALAYFQGTPMPTNNAKGLEEVLGLLAEMSPGPLECGNGAEVEPATFIYCDDTLGSAVANCAFSHTVAVSREQARRNAAGFAAAVNYLRSRGAAIAELVELKRAYCECDGTQEAEDKAICALLDKIDELAALRQVGER